jgi:hypothetical protein
MKMRGLIVVCSLVLAFFISQIILVQNEQDDIFKNRLVNKNKHEKKQEKIQGTLEYYKLIKGDPSRGGIVDPLLVYNAHDYLKNNPGNRSTLALNWESKGPDNQGGRTRAIVVDKDLPNVLYAGGVSGGIYKSTNGGTSWIRKIYSAEFGGLIISCMTQAKDTEGTLYAGTGEGFFTNLIPTPGDGSHTGNIGGGVYKSVDRGETWTFLTSTDPSKTGNSKWQNVQAIATHPVNPSTIYAGTDGGLYKSTDKGETWGSSALDLPGGYTSRTIIDLQISPDGQTIFVAVTNSNNSRCRVYRAINGTETFELVDGISEYTKRISLGIAPSNPNYIYALATSNGLGGYITQYMEGIYRSTDNGDTWEKIVDGNTSTDPIDGQGTYNSCIGIDPYNEHRFFVGGVGFYAWEFKPVQNITLWYQAASRTEFLDNENQYKNPRYVHADKHTIVFDTKTNPYRMYLGHDGGISVSFDAQNEKYPSYKDINQGYITTQFFGLGAATDGYIVGGTQDNGTFRIEVFGLTGSSGTEILFNDGFNAEISSIDPRMYFFEYQSGNIYRSNDRGKNREALIYDNDKNYPPLPTSQLGWNTPFRLWEAMKDSVVSIRDSIIYDNQNNPIDTLVRKVDSAFHICKFFVASRDGVYMSPDVINFNADTIRWYKISSGLNFGYPYHPLALEYSEDGDIIYVGGSRNGDGYLYRITGINKAYYDNPTTFNPTSQGLKTELIETWSNRTVTGIQLSKRNQNHMVIALANYVSGNHIYISTNALDPDKDNITFRSVHGTGLPEIPVYDAVIHSESNSYDTIIAVTEMGVFTTSNASATSVVWTEENSNMDRVPTYRIRQVKPAPWHRGYEYYIATHGMGVFYTSTLIPNLGIKTSPKPVQKLGLSVYPNPVVSKLNVSFDLNKAETITAQIYNIKGQMLRQKQWNDIHTGNNVKAIPVHGLQKGTYFLRLISDSGITESSRFIVLD